MVVMALPGQAFLQWDCPRKATNMGLGQPEISPLPAGL